VTRNTVAIALARNGIFVAVAVMIAVFSIINIRFLSPQNLQNLLQQAAELGIIALPMALLIMAGGLDFSVGAVASLAAVVSAATMTGTGNWPIGVAAGLVVGLVTGLINGVLTTYLGLNSIIVTIGALSVWSGLALLLSGGRSIVGLPTGFAEIGHLSLGPVRLPFLIFVILAVAIWLTLARTAFGRQLLASGGNERAAALMGIRTNRVRVILYVATATAAALAGMLLVAKFQSAGPKLGEGLEIQAITVVLLGGVAMTGGSGRVSGVISGLLFVSVMRNGLVILGVSEFIQVIATGAVLVIAIAFDGSVQRMVKQSWSAARPEPAASTPPAADERTPPLTER
jgi:ribose/xylose/arabinose/galactoside ABC-type transport system permease subunit